MANEKRGFLREEKDGGDKYRIKHELITHYKLRSVQGLVTMKAGPHHRTSASRGTTTGGSSPAVGLQSASPPRQGLEREEGGVAHPGGLQGRTQWGRLHCLRLLSPPSATLPLEKQL